MLNMILISNMKEINANRNVKANYEYKTGIRLLVKTI